MIVSLAVWSARELTRDSGIVLGGPMNFSPPRLVALHEHGSPLRILLRYGVGHLDNVFESWYCGKGVFVSKNVIVYSKTHLSYLSSQKCLHFVRHHADISISYRSSSIGSVQPAAPPHRHPAAAFRPLSFLLPSQRPTRLQLTQSQKDGPKSRHRSKCLSLTTQVISANCSPTKR